jgi:uncharacterized protein YegJ (DUF2314 family)
VTTRTAGAAPSGTRTMNGAGDVTEQVFLSPTEDPDMARASADARATFKFFWRELFWERHRIVRGHDLTAVMLPFSDPQPASGGQDPAEERMWVDEVDFDGRDLSGTLVNSPNWLTSVEQGDRVSAPLSRLGDWLFSIHGVAYGAFTVNLLRARMDRAERQQHDEAWGLDFGDPHQVRIIYDKQAPSPEPPVDPREHPFADHPMCTNMVEKAREALAAQPGAVTERDERGWTLLHQHALAGDLAIVRLLLDLGADPAARTGDGRTAADLAASLQWEPITQLLTAR